VFHLPIFALLQSGGCLFIFFVWEADGSYLVIVTQPLSHLRIEVSGNQFLGGFSLLAVDISFLSDLEEKFYLTRQGHTDIIY
jgi:hypothetical protein